jgi:hypothetical protein
MRLVCKRFDEACIIGIKISCDHELPLLIKTCNLALERDFDEKTIESFKNARDSKLGHQNTITKAVEEAPKKCGAGLWKSYKDIARCLKPNPLLTKPIFCVMQFKHTLPDVSNLDFRDFNDTSKLWLKVRSQLKKNNFVSELKDFDVKRVT